MHLFFPIFLFLYFSNYQSPSTSLLLSEMAGQPIHGYAWLFGALLTALFSAIGLGLEERLQRSGRTAYGGYILSTFLAVTLTNIPWPITNHDAQSWTEFAIRTLVLIILSALTYVLYERFIKRHPDRRHLLIPHATLLLTLALIMGVGAMQKDTDNFERRTAAAILRNNFECTYNIGRNSLPTTPRLFALRAYAMSLDAGNGGLPAQLFSRPTPAATSSATLLFPNDDLQTLTLAPDTLYAHLGLRPMPAETAIHYFKRCAQEEVVQNRNSKTVTTKSCKRFAADYYLCALLLDRKIDLFAQELPTYYSHELSVGKNLPRYYAEALLLYMRSTATPAVTYPCTTTEANYRDYCKMRDTYPDATIRRNMLHRSYGETYWWYFTYGK